jgi:hypothetical protein
MVNPLVTYRCLHPYTLGTLTLRHKHEHRIEKGRGEIGGVNLPFQPGVYTTTLLMKVRQKVAIASLHVLSRL